ncbi:Cytochrome P450 monooxygenase hepH [Fulvia fulva]|uniref:Cytochrome P450 monooxygenase hepH n=1 Tax=Passalora fulva TaxID=5499 RepID=A0A9Q8P6I3_PASFU|nr:Cytochrome P450 monooxygenase hepH [Fulvia fulva]KAK4629730.1 Cytochrome P450 monooxygenase hepH [Fulvia fulva]KAK4629770.1 Cytochrome P450 monooxygenase hepH [Fulvia fulva]UJO14986.1 Cytochrome P450 monooxygenase hepH [Fulvia fulva]WPV12389.1 Cytochrome P450 monooxygenase hepH [Fulvia fulva]WPV27971.1 Cytochrome P450 monooxygenase hepH [Fulvia fulva]
MATFLTSASPLTLAVIGFAGLLLTQVIKVYELYYDIFVAPSGQFFFELNRLHDIYGPVIRCNPDAIHVRDLYWYDILYTGPGHVRTKWDRSNRANASPGSVASAEGHELHRARRQALNPFFSKRTVDRLGESIRGYTEKLC